MSDAIMQADIKSMVNGLLFTVSAAIKAAKDNRMIAPRFMLSFSMTSPAFREDCSLYGV